MIWGEQGGGRMGEGKWLGSWDGYVHTAILNVGNQQGPTYSTRNSAQCYHAAWMGGGLREEEIHAYV